MRRGARRRRHAWLNQEEEPASSGPRRSPPSPPLGSDLTHLDPGDVSLLTNDEVLAVDRAGVAAGPVSQSSQQQVWRSRKWLTGPGVRA